jgi:hypothetical protein
LVSGIVRSHVGKRHAAQFRAEARTQRNDFHRRILRCRSLLQISSKTGRLARKTGKKAFG